MAALNIRRSPQEAYDPKQRIVGGIVLSLIILLIYGFLKLLAGFSATAGGSYALPEALSDEVEISAENMVNTDNPDALILQGDDEVLPATIATPSKPLPMGFVFLDINGNPMQEEVFQTNNNDYTVDTSSKKWVVQVASFKERSRAQALVDKLKSRNFSASISSSGRWFVVRLDPQDDRASAQNQRTQLRNKLNIRRTLIKKLD